MYTAVALEVTVEDADQAEQENRLTGIASDGTLGLLGDRPASAGAHALAIPPRSRSNPYCNYSHALPRPDQALPRTHRPPGRPLRPDNGCRERKACP